METHINIEDIVRTQVAQKILESISVEDRNKVLKESLSKSLKEALRPWVIEKAIKEDVERYMIEYIKDENVQLKIKKSVQERVDVLMNGIIEVIISGAQDDIKSDYRNFVDKKSITDVKE